MESDEPLGQLSHHLSMFKLGVDLHGDSVMRYCEHVEVGCQNCQHCSVEQPFCVFTPQK